MSVGGFLASIALIGVGITCLYAELVQGISSPFFEMLVMGMMGRFLYQSHRARRLR